MWDTCASDHAALSTEFRENAVGGESANTKHHVCRIGQCVNNLVLRWQHEKADVYARHISENMELLAQFDEAERAGNVDKLAFCVRSLIVQAASSRAVGMSAQAFFFLGWCYSYGPQQGPDRQQKKEERGLKQRRKQKEAAQGDPEPKKGNQEKEKKIK